MDSGGSTDTSSGGSDAGGGDETGSDGTSSVDSGPSRGCKFADGGDFPTFTKPVCQDAPQCALFIHQIDCCGSKAAYGVYKTELAALQAAEQRWETECVACQCNPKPTTAQNNKSGPDNTITVDCVNDPQYPPPTCLSAAP
jgi:hypothetical protein